MFKFLKKDKEEVSYNAFGSGKVIPLEEVPDMAFAEKLLGDGYAIELTSGEITAPVDGELTVVFPTGHAYGITTEDGKEVLVHIGIDTVDLNGKGFDSKVKQGDTVKKGDLLAIVDLDLLKAEGKSIITPFIITSGEKLEVLKLGELVNKDTTDLFKFL